MSCRYRPLPIPGRLYSPDPCWQYPGLWTQSQSTLAARKGHLLFLTFLFPAAERSKDISLVAVPVISPNGCGPLAQGLGGKAAEGQRSTFNDLRGWAFHALPYSGQNYLPSWVSHSEGQVPESKQMGRATFSSEIGGGLGPVHRV